MPADSSAKYSMHQYSSDEERQAAARSLPNAVQLVTGTCLLLDAYGPVHARPAWRSMGCANKTCHACVLPCMAKLGNDAAVTHEGSQYSVSFIATTKCVSSEYLLVGTLGQW